MTLKDLRLTKKLSQQECADILGISRRTFQNIENSEIKDNPKMDIYLNTLKNYEESNIFTSNVVVGSDLKKLTNKVTNYKKRYCFKVIEDYFSNDYRGKVLLLFGLRRTGKTVLLFQTINYLNFDKCAYIKAKETNTMGDIISDLDILNKKGIKNVFIDEITLVSDFINTAATFSDIYSMMGMKIVLSGTDSLGFALANIDELYDRSVTIHTSYIPYREFSYLLDIHSIDTYIEYGGTLMKENIGYDDPLFKEEEISFKDDESTRKYIDSSISKNIQRSLKNNHFGSEFYSLRELYEQNELTNVINRIIEDMSHRFVLSVIEDKFDLHDLGSARQLLTKDKEEKRRTALYNINTEEVINKFKEIVDIKEKEDLNVEIKKEHINQIKKYLFRLDLIKVFYEKNDLGERRERIIFTQPGMRYSLAKGLVYSLLDDKYFISLSVEDRNIIKAKILEDVKGRMLEDIVALEMSSYKKEENDIFKYKFITGGEYDVVSYIASSNSYSLYEIKHSNQVVYDSQTKYLHNENMLSHMSRLYGKLDGRYVLYRGNDHKEDDINYLNVEKFLENLGNR